MHYDFPLITTIDDVLPFIENRPEFIVAKKDGYTVINYMVAMHDTFGTPTVGMKMGPGAKPYRKYAYADLVRRECRGIVFDENGDILSRRLHKFFNVNERAETMQESIDLDRPHKLVYKLDGSMITPLVIRGHLRWGTKMGVTDTAMQAECWVAHRQNYINFALWCHETGTTPIFEWCSRQNRIVIDHGTENLVLLAMRNNCTGEYFSREELVKHSEFSQIPLVSVQPVTKELPLAELINNIRTLENEEGFIIQYDDGHMLKVKTDWYVRIHKAKDKILQEKNVIELLLKQEADDVKPYLSDADRKRLNRFETDFWIGVNQSAKLAQSDFEFVTDHFMDRKAVAQSSGFTQDEKSMIFKQMDGHKAYDVVLNIIARNLSTQTKVDGVRHLFGGAKWNDILRAHENDFD